jgi:septum formation protein
MTNPQKIILASSSPFRKALLQRFGLRFETISPDIDETRLAGESAEKLVLRLAEAKARKLALTEPDALIIGSDQVAQLGKRLLSKPGNRENAFRQLQMSRDKAVTFLTGLCVINSTNQACMTETVRYKVYFRDYTDAEIDRYLEIEQPYDCAGSFKSEQLGISLMRKMQGEDPTALIGLPLIKLAEMLRSQQVKIP